MVQVLVCDPDPILHHAEVILRDNKPVGYVRSNSYLSLFSFFVNWLSFPLVGSYGHTLGGGVGLAMVEGGDVAVTPSWLSSGEET